MYYQLFIIIYNIDLSVIKQMINLIMVITGFSRNDEKTAQDYKVQGGSVLHLVLALRGGH